MSCIGAPILRKSAAVYFPTALMIRLERYPLAVMKLEAPAMAMATKKGFESTPSSCAAIAAMGKTSATAALLVMISVKTEVIIQMMASTPAGPIDRTMLMASMASRFATPEFCMALLMANADAIEIIKSQLMALV